MTNSTSKNFPPETSALREYYAPLEPGDIKQTWASKAIIFVLCAAVILTTVAYGTVHQPILALFYTSSAVVVILWAIDAWSSGFLRFNSSWLQLPLIAAIVFGIFQLVPFGSIADSGGVSGIPRTISQDPYSTQFAVLHWLALLIYFAAALAFIDSSKRLRKVVYIITIFGFVFAFFAIIQVVLSPDKIYGIYEPRFARPFGSFVNRHNFAAYMELTLALPLGLFFAGAVEKDKRLLYLTAIALMGVALILSGSRGGFISLLGEVFFLVLVTTKARGPGRLLLRIGAAAALIGCIIVGTVLLGGESSLTRFAESVEMKDPTTSRVHIWDTTLQIIGQNPIFGAGLNAFGVAYTAQDTLNGMERAEQAHNDYLQTLSDGGVVGGLIGLAFLVLFFRAGFSSIKTNNKFRRGIAIGALAGCFAILVHSMFDFVLHTTAIAVLFLTLLALVVVSKRDEPAEENSEPPRRKTRSDNVTPLVRK